MVPIYQQHIAKPVKANASIGWQYWARIELGIELVNFVLILILREVDAMGYCRRRVMALVVSDGS